MVQRKVVLGLGNLLMGDEGFGIHALGQLRKFKPRLNTFELVDGGVLGLNLLPLVLDCNHLLVIDAIDAGKPPGTLIELSREDLLSPVAIKLSEHQIGFQEVLGIANFHCSLPDYLHAVGIQPKTISLGTELSPEISNNMDEVLCRVDTKLQNWGL